MKPSKIVLGIFLAFLISIMPVYGLVNSSLYATEITSPGGQIWLPNSSGGGHLWVSDHVQGFCRLDAQIPLPIGNYTINRSTCIKGEPNTEPGPVSPGQPSFDSVNNLVYVPDNAAISGANSGVWRLNYNPLNETVSSPILIANSTSLGGDKPAATALVNDKLYVGFLMSGNISQINLTTTTVNSSYGSVFDRSPVTGLTSIGNYLYISEKSYVTKINLTNGGKAQTIPNLTGITPTAITSDKIDTLYIGIDTSVLKFNISTNISTTHVNSGILPNSIQTNLIGISGLALDSSKALFISDDPTAGANVLTGRIWTTGSAAVPVKPIIILGGNLHASFITAPGGQIWLPNSSGGGHLWVSDMLQGVCRIDEGMPLPSGNFTINSSTCLTNSLAPGQPSFDSVNNLVYVPDKAARIGDNSGIWRFKYSPITETLSNPILIANISQLGSEQPTASAFGPDGKLYIGFLRSGNVVQLSNLSGTIQFNTTFGTTVIDGKPIMSFAFVGKELYLAESGITVINITNGGRAKETGIMASVPVALNYDKIRNTLYILDSPFFSGNSKVLRLNLSTQVLETYATIGVFPDLTTTPFIFASSLGLDNIGNLYIGDDPTQGLFVRWGHIWRIPAGTPPESVVITPPGATIPKLYSSLRITSPTGFVWLGNSMWVSDQALGLCRLDPKNPDNNGNYTINMTTCISELSGIITPGQPAYDKINNLVYVPDAKSKNIWRLNFDNRTQTLNNSTALNIGDLAFDIPFAVAFGSDRNLYVGFADSNNISQIKNPNSTNHIIKRDFGKTSNGLGVSGLAFSGLDLYIVEAGTISKLNITTLNGTAVPQPAFASSIVEPAAIASNGSTLYIVDIPFPNGESHVWKYDVPTDNLSYFATSGRFPNGTITNFKFAFGIGLDSSGNVFIGDDPTEGLIILNGRIWTNAPTAVPTLPIPQVRGGNLYASFITSPGGVLWLSNSSGGGHLWVSDHMQGFCRLDAQVPDIYGNYTINQSSCVTNAALSYGQPSYDSANNFVYVPDNAAVMKHNSGVWRLKFDPVSETITSVTLIANMSVLGGEKPTATALGKDGSLYVGYIRSDNITKITNPSGNVNTIIPNFANTTDTLGISGLASLGNDIYIAQTEGVTKINITLGGIPKLTNITAISPTAITSDGINTLYIAETIESTTIIRFNVSTNTESLYANIGVFPDLNVTNLKFVSGFAIYGGNLFVADDPTAGAIALAGRIWKYTGPTPIVEAPPLPALKQGTLYARGGITAPALIWIDKSLWVLDHVLGVCRLDKKQIPDINGVYAINQSTCIIGTKTFQAPIAPGQSAYDSVNNSVYIPDYTSKSLGVWRLKFDPDTQTLGTPVLLNNNNIKGTRPTSVALGKDGKLYVGSLKSNNIVRITTPNNNSQTVEIFGKTSDGRAVSGITIVGNNLYIAEKTGLAVINLSIGGIAKPIIGSSTSPTAISSYGNMIYLADTPLDNSTVYRYDTTTGIEDVYAYIGVFPNLTTTRFKFVSGLASDKSGNLFIGDDPSAGGVTPLGRIWTTAPIIIPVITDNNGNVTSSISAVSTLGNVTLTIPNGTQIKDKAGNVLTNVNITMNSSANLIAFSNAFGIVSVGGVPIGEVVTMSPVGATFTPPIQMRFNYTNASLLAAGITPSQLRVMFYNQTTGIWEVQQPFTLNATGQYIIANISHFSTFAIGMPLTPSTSTVSNSGGGGSTGGSGVISSEPYTNIEASERIEKDLIANNSITYIFRYNIQYLINEIIVIGKENEGSITLKAEILKETSKNAVKPAQGIEYKNLNIWIGTNKLNEAVIKFKVNNSWIESNSLSENNIKMLKWDGSKWVTLETSVKEKDSTYTYFEAKTTSLSTSFVILGEKTENIEVKAQEVIATEKPSSTTQVKDTSIPTSTPKASGFTVLTLLLALYMVLRKRR